MTRTVGHGFSVRPRVLVVAVLVVAALAGVAVWYWLQQGAGIGRVQLEGFSADATGTVSFAGSFPSAGDAPLANPLGIAWSGDALFVAESDAGVVRVFDTHGGRIGTIAIEPAANTPSVYPSGLAIGEGQLAIVDSAANRVIIVAAEPAESADVLLTLGTGDQSLGQPTAVAFEGGEWYVADGADGTVKVYDGQGAYVRSLGGELLPSLGFVGGMALVDSDLTATASNAGRVVVLSAESGELRMAFPSQYALPRGLAPISGGLLAIVDTFERSVLIVDGKGVAAGAIDAETVPEGTLVSPRAVAWLGDERRLYVTDAELGRVMVYNVRARGEQ